MKNFTIGLLYPRSSIYPAIGFDVVDGFKTGIKHYTNDDGSMRLHVDSIGIGGIGKDVKDKAERMLMEYNPDIIVAFIDHFAAEQIQPLFNAANKILVVVEPGGSVPTDWTPEPLRYHITLDAALGSRMVGNMAAKAGVTNAAFVSSFYDGGYMNCYSYTNGFLKEGGKVGYNFVVPFKHEELRIEALVTAVTELNINGILCQMSAESGRAFFDAYRQTDIADKLPFYASPFLLEESFLSTLPYPFDGIKGVVPWASVLQNDTNSTFINSLQEEAGKNANCFSALAWDAAHLAVKISEKLKESNNNPRKAADGILSLELDGTRGKIVADRNSNYFISSMYEAEIIPGERGNSSLKIFAPTDTDIIWRDQVAQPVSSAFSRWTNTYLCTT